MSKEVYFVAHPEVVIDPEKEITSWSLSEKGIRRAKDMLKQPWIPSIKNIFSSKEQKALDLAQIVADHLNLEVMALEELGEIDRSSTGFIPPKDFWPVVEKFFATPFESAKGWERAVDAQKRIVSAVERIVASTPEGNTFIASHGAVGALLLSHLKKTEITMENDLPKDKGGGYYFVFDSEGWTLLQEWKPIEKI